MLKYQATEAVRHETEVRIGRKKKRKKKKKQMKYKYKKNKTLRSKRKGGRKTDVRTKGTQPKNN